MNGYIKLHRQITKWEWYDDANTFRMFMHLLLNANHEDGKWHGHEIKRGQWITSRKKLAKELGISEQSVRTALHHLISTNEITIESTKTFTIVTIENYNKYQGAPPQINQEGTPQINQQPTNNQPTINQELTTNKNEKNKKNEKKDKKERNIYKGVPEELVEPLKGFEEMRKTIKKPLTERAFNRIVKRVQELSEGDMQLAVSIIDQSIVNSWADVYPLKQDYKPKKEINIWDC